MSTLRLKKPWNPIKTAPDDRPIICYNRAVGQYITKKQDGQYPMYAWDGAAGVWYPEPTHWRDLEPDPV